MNEKILAIWLSEALEPGSEYGKNFWKNTEALKTSTNLPPQNMKA